jgi:hypothetical protein
MLLTTYIQNPNILTKLKGNTLALEAARVHERREE